MADKKFSQLTTSELNAIQEVLGIPQTRKPLLSEFTRLDAQALPQVSNGKGGILIHSPRDATAAHKPVFLARALPSTTFTARALFRYYMNPAGENSIGLGIRDPATGRIQTFVRGNIAGAVNWSEQRWTSLTALSSNAQNYTAPSLAEGAEIWIGMRSDGTTVWFEWSLDGDKWLTLHLTTTLAAWAAAPTEVGIWSNPHSGHPYQALVKSFQLS